MKLCTGSYQIHSNLLAVAGNTLLRICMHEANKFSAGALACHALNVMVCCGCVLRS
jgi:hypothetical protein